MLMTTMLLFIAMREIWHWSLPLAAAVAGALAVVDAGFVSANMMKVADGGYIPLLLAGAVYGVMVVWHLGVEAVGARFRDTEMPIDAFMAQIAAQGVARVPGTAVFLTRTLSGAPPMMVWHVRYSRALHERVFILAVATQMVPYVPLADRIKVEQIAPDIWRGLAQFGFMERPDIPALLADAHARGCTIDLADLTYFVGHETVVAREHHTGLPRLIELMFAFMQRNSLHVTDYFRLPAELVVEVGRQVAI
jgi:KUP system potassium uptake protein